MRMYEITYTIKDWKSDDGTIFLDKPKTFLMISKNKKTALKRFLETDNKCALRKYILKIRRMRYIV